MISAVLDTDIIVAAILMPNGLPARILLAALAVDFVCISSDAIVSEVLTVLARDRIRRRYTLDPVTIARVQHFLQSDAVRVPITTVVQGVASHAQDDLILATAISAQADYLVTGDRELLALGQYQGAQIVTPRDFATILGLEMPS